MSRGRPARNRPGRAARPSAAEVGQDRARRATRHRICGIVGVCLAVASVFLISLVAALFMAALGTTNITAATMVEQTGEIPRALRIAMFVSAAGFLVFTAIAVYPRLHH